MTTSSLTLIPFGKQSYRVGLLENDGRPAAMERIVEQATENNSIFADLSYEFILDCEDLSMVQDVRVYINDAFEPSTFSNGHICFPARGNSDRRIFLDCYGFVEISLTLELNDNTERCLSTEYLPVLVRRGQLNESVKAMVNYVYNNQESLLLNGEPKPRNLAGLKESGYRSLAAQLILAEEIAGVYESSYGYFKANSRFEIKKVATVDRLERLQSVTPLTLEYIVSHPEHLKPVNSNIGVRVGNRVFHPQKVLSLQNVNSYDIYENRVVLGFLHRMIDEVLELQSRCRALLQQIPDDEDYSADYIYSSFFMFSETRKMLEDGLQRLTNLYGKFSQLWSMYRNALMIPEELIATKPRPTATFMSVPQYNKIFTRIHQWFNFGIYDFAKENFMLSFIKISSLYESFILTKLISYFKERGYLLTQSKRCSYPATSPKWKYRNTRCDNTFSFANGQHSIKLYYQPVIYDTDRSSVNGIFLYRNNSIPVSTGDNDDDRPGGRYYAPDYLIEVNNGTEKRYLIIDAKFSDVGNVRRHYVKDLAFKYLFSISTMGDNNSIAGMCIMYGKCSDREILQSAYDKQMTMDEIRPIAEVFPLIEGIAQDDQYNKLDLLLKKMIH